MKPFNQFDMEQEIMTCWNICEDLDTLMEGVLEREISRDQIANVLLGMKDLYHLKFEKLFESFEAMCREKSKIKEMGYTHYDRDEDNMNARGEVL